MKRIIKIIIVIIILLALYLLVLSYINNKNYDYLNNITKNIKDNYKLTEEIITINEYGNYYILTTKKNIIILNKEYEEILIKDIKILAPNPNNYAIIYKTNKIMYEETILKNNKITYKYYDATNGNLIKETTMKEEVR